MPSSIISPTVKKALSHNVHVCGVQVPKGAVFGVFPACVIKGRQHRRMYAWVCDLPVARSNRHFVVYTMRQGDEHPRREYVDSLHGYASTLKKFIMNLPASEIVKVSSITRQSMRGEGPRLRKTGVYNLRGVPSYDSSPHVMTHNLVTNGCKVGHNFYNEEGYCNMVLRMPTPSYSK